MINFLIKRSRLIFSITLLSSIILAFGVSFINIDFSFDSFFPKNTPQYQYYQKFKYWFTEDQNFAIYVAIKTPSKDIFELSFLQSVDSLFDQIMQIEGIDSVITLTDLKEIKRTGLGFKQIPYIDLTAPSSISLAKDKLSEHPTLVGTFYTKDLQYVCGYITIQKELLDEPERDLICHQIKQQLEESTFDHIISGIPFIRSQYVSRIKYELIFFTLASILLVILVLYFTYKHIWGIVIPLVAVLLGLLGLTGVIGFSGGSLTLLSNLLIPIMFVVGMSDVIHIITKYLQERTKGLTVQKSMSVTLKEIGFAVFLTSLTTAIGFASLSVSRVPPIKIFGIYAAIGVMIAFCVALAVLPFCLMLFDQLFVRHKQSLTNSSFWDTWLTQLHHWVHRNQLTVLSGFFTGLAFCIYFIMQIPTNTYLIDGISTKDPMRKSIDFFEKQSYGMHPFEIGFHAKEGHRLTEPEILNEMKKIQDFLSTQSRFSPFLSLASFISESNYVYHFNRDQHRDIPDQESKVIELLDWGVMRGGESILKSMYEPEEQVGRISAKIADLGTDSMEVLYEKLDKFIEKECDTSLFTYTYTGQAYLTELNLQYLQKSLMYGLIIAFIVIGILMGLLYKSWQMLWISMIPNVIPLLFTGGIMGLFGITLNASTAIIFVIAFGIAVDDTIHFLNRFRLEKQQGKDTDTALHNTTLGTGKAMILTSLILIAGFIILTASDFGSTFHTGLFTALTILFALLADLLLLPILLRKYIQ